MNKPLISIIIPTYNRAQLIEETLDSVLEQTYVNWECIVVDDGSSDKTNKLLENYCKKDSRFQYHHRPKNRLKGANACRNIGMEKSIGDYLMFLDSDDLLKGNCLETRVLCASKNDEYDFYIFNMNAFKLIAGDENILINKHPNNNEQSYLEMFLSNDIPWPITTIFIKKNKLSISFDEDLARFQDVLFSIKLLIASNNVKVFKDLKPDCFYRITKSSLSRIYDKKFIKIVVKSYSQLINKIIDEIKKHDVKINYTNFLSTGFMSIYELFIFPKKRIIYFFRMSKIALKYDLLSVKKIMLLNILLIYNILGLQKVKGLGYYKLSNKNKSIN